MEDTGAQQIEIGSPIHLSLEKFQSVDLAFDFVRCSKVNRRPPEPPIDPRLDGESFTSRLILGHAQFVRLSYNHIAFRGEITLANLPPGQGGRQSADAAGSGQ